jgi:hypothetical protein
MELRELRAIARGINACTAAWPDEKIDTYIGQAVRLYSAHRPRRWRHELDLITGTQAYDLPGGHGFVRVVSVEYPGGDGEFLGAVAEWSSKFQAGGRVYALRGVADTGEPEEDTIAGQIVFAETVVTGETAVIEYLGEHPAPAVGDDDAQITVPRYHLEAITAYVDFATHFEAETDEVLEITTASVVLSQLGEEARRAWNRYKEVMDRLVWLGTNSGLGLGSMPRWSNLGL